MGGLAGALGGRDVGVVATGTLVAGGRPRAAPSTGCCGAPARERAVLVPGDRRTVGAAAIEVLAPAPERATAAAEPNDLSLVVRVTVRGVRILLHRRPRAPRPRRASSPTAIDLRADVLKVPHHGSGDADPEFLAASGARRGPDLGRRRQHLRPSDAPAADLAAQAGMRVHRTDREGDLARGVRRGWGVAARVAAASAATVGPAAACPDARRSVGPA